MGIEAWNKITVQSGLFPFPVSVDYGKTKGYNKLSSENIRGTIQ